MINNLLSIISRIFNLKINIITSNYRIIMIFNIRYNMDKAVAQLKEIVQIIVCKIHRGQKLTYIDLSFEIENDDIYTFN